MKVALITPKGWEALMSWSDMRLALAIPSLTEYYPYKQSMWVASNKGQLVICDNGAAEGMAASGKDIKAAAELLRATEIVLPDVLHQWSATTVAIRKYLVGDGSTFKGHYMPVYRYMAVLQGTTLEELKGMVRRLAGENGHARGPRMPEDITSKIHTLGIPRHLITSLDKLSVRIDLANWIEEHYPGRWQIHLLGTNPMWCYEVAYAAKYASHIRSVDTSMPFNYALANTVLAKGAPAIGRPEKYFDKIYAEPLRNMRSLCESNVHRLLEWASGS